MIAAPPHASSASPVLLDGGMSNALEDRGQDVTGALWTARLLRDAPEEIAAVHRAYYRAGARVVTTASYQASVPGFMDAGVDRAEAERLVRRSVTLARDVRDELAADGRTRWVAASVGPYGAVLADGSEYRGRYSVSRALLHDFHRSRMELLAEAGPDFLAVETIPDRDEAEVLVEILQELGLPAWFSYSAGDGHTRAGQPLADAFAVAASAPSVFAVGVNCCAPGDVLEAVRLAVATTGRPAVAYPNSGEQWDATLRRWRGGAAFDVGLVPVWVEAGAAYVGGCCRVGPPTISAVARRLATE
ncbi:MAG TPA: homocysteine S-methyltransferase [Segeticoccus sp.]|uniref:homocysteine S-methyltransferase n=1 Tax=Segeticoccus sp. TaxID=2706531 RepID=UPI002D8049CA|nr:homocysteine S-methyltransferase [Segeticoccus sp.]HET8599975.1 homocysteine S-methyltransferase [Segeticoccus sp.]